MVVDFSTVLLEFCALSVYVVVSLGLTIVEPLDPTVPAKHLVLAQTDILFTAPDAVLVVIVTIVALAVFQFNVLDPPELISEGLAEKEVIVGAITVGVEVGVC